jgi:hypothetical protein
MSLTKPSLAGNNLSRLGTGKSITFFTVSGTKSVGYDYSEPPALLLYLVITIKKTFVGAPCENFVLSKEIQCKQLAAAEKIRNLSRYIPLITLIATK